MLSLEGQQEPWAQAKAPLSPQVKMKPPNPHQAPHPQPTGQQAGACTGALNARSTGPGQGHLALHQARIRTQTQQRPATKPKRGPS